MVQEIEGEEEMHKVREDNDYMDQIQVTPRPTQVSDTKTGNSNVSTRHRQFRNEQRKEKRANP
jgi:hypothetical protein